MTKNASERPEQQPIARGVKQSAKTTNLSESFIRKAIAKGELKATRVHRRVLIKDSDLRAWLDSCSKAA